jgi:hypothetical protein
MHGGVFQNADVNASNAFVVGVSNMRGVATVHHAQRVSAAGAAELASGYRPSHGVRQLRYALSSHPHTGSAPKRRLCRAVQQSVDEHACGSRDPAGNSSGEFASLDDVAVPGGGFPTFGGCPECLVCARARAQTFRRWPAEVRFPS